MRTKARMACAHCVMGVLLGAGLLKAGDLPSFAASLESWVFLPRALRPIIAVGVPSLEIVVSMLWFLGLARRASLVSGAALLTVFSAGLGAHLIVGHRPECRCLGIILAYEHGQRAGLLLVVRNVALIGALGFALWPGQKDARVGGARPCGHDAARARRRAACANGFSLLETLLTVGLIGALVLIALPQLAGMRASAQRTVSVSNLRQHIVTFGSYAAGNRGEFPRYTDPNATLTVIRRSRFTFGVRYFGGHAIWNFALADYYDGNPVNESFFPGSYEDPFVGSSAAPLWTPYFYAHAFIASPPYWNLESRRDNRSQLVVTRQADVLRPSHKGLLLDYLSYRGSSLDAPPLFGDPPRLSQPVLIGFVDGSARGVARAEIARPCPVGTGSPEYRGVEPVMHTLDGIRGSDIK